MCRAATKDRDRNLCKSDRVRRPAPRAIEMANRPCPPRCRRVGRDWTSASEAGNLRRAMRRPKVKRKYKTRAGGEMEKRRNGAMSSRGFAVPPATRLSVSIEGQARSQQMTRCEHCYPRRAGAAAGFDLRIGMGK